VSSNGNSSIAEEDSLAEEQTFLHQGNVYVSNTRVVIDGTTYATANITSVRATFTPANRGCAGILILFSGLMLLGGLGGLAGGGDAAGAAVTGGILLIIGVFWYRSLTPTHHVMLASSSGERQGLTSKDGDLVHRVTAAIAQAIIFRG
jgi:hypothetical protein